MTTIFLTAITGECSLFALHGIRPRAYNPFPFLRRFLKKQGITLGPSRLELLLYLRETYKASGIVEHGLLGKAIAKLKEQGKKIEPEESTPPAPTL